MLTTLFQATVDFTSKAESAGLPGATTTFGEWIGKLLTGALTIGALMLLVYLIWGGIGWLTSGGDAGKIQKARDKIVQAVIGLIVLAASIAIFTLVQRFLGINVLNFENGDSSSPYRVGTSTQPTKPVPGRIPIQ